MGPPLFSGGNATLAVKLQESPELQWGRRCSAAEMTLAFSAVPVSPLLQWGRRCSAAEIFGIPERYLVTCVLQWGRRCSAAEMTAGGD